MSRRFRLKVLVADDASAIHSVFADLAPASSIPFDLVTARNDIQCMALLSRDRINVAFIDVNMPEMNGMDAVDAVRRIGSKTFIVPMSTSANTSAASSSRASSRSTIFWRSPSRPSRSTGFCTPTAASRCPVRR